MLRNIWHIMGRDLRLELRGASGFLGSLLYLAAICFVVFKVFGSFEGPVRMGLFWVIYLFTCINIVASAFGGSGLKRKFSYYTLYDPVDYFFAKVCFSFAKLLLAGIILAGMQTIFSGQALKDMILFGKTLLLAAVGLSAILCLLSAIASYSEKQMSLVSILALPLVIPVLLLSMRLSLVSERFFTDPATGKYLMLLGGIDLMVLSLAVIFIPIIWKS